MSIGQTYLGVVGGGSGEQGLGGFSLDLLVSKVVRFGPKVCATSNRRTFMRPFGSYVVSRFKQARELRK